MPVEQDPFQNYLNVKISKLIEPVNFSSSEIIFDSPVITTGQSLCSHCMPEKIKSYVEGYDIDNLLTCVDSEICRAFSIPTLLSILVKEDEAGAYIDNMGNGKNRGHRGISAYSLSRIPTEIVLPFVVRLLIYGKSKLEFELGSDLIPKMGSIAIKLMSSIIQDPIKTLKDISQKTSSPSDAWFEEVSENDLKRRAISVLSKNPSEEALLELTEILKKQSVDSAVYVDLTKAIENFGPSDPIVEGTILEHLKQIKKTNDEEGDLSLIFQSLGIISNTYWFQYSSSVEFLNVTLSPPKPGADDVGRAAVVAVKKVVRTIFGG